MKNIAILYIGFHYAPITDKIRNYNWKDSYKNQKEYIYDQFKNDNIDVFLSSYKSEYQEQMLSDFKPKSYYLHNYEEKMKDCHYGRTTNILKVLELLNDYIIKNNIKYDNVILLRFDLLLLQPLNKLNIDYNGFNVGFFNYCKKAVDDVFTFCLFNGKYINTFINYINSDDIKKQFYIGGYSSHIQKLDFEQRTKIDMNLLVKDGPYIYSSGGWHVNLNPIYFCSSQSNETIECYCCFGKFHLRPNDLGQLKCGHKFHQECIHNIIKNDVCPHCRNKEILDKFKYSL